MKPMQIAAILFMLAAIVLLVFGIMSDKPMVTIAMPLLVVGISLGTVANAKNKKQK